jgi:hypothetical protein
VTTPEEARKHASTFYSRSLTYPANSELTTNSLLQAIYWRLVALDADNDKPPVQPVSDGFVHVYADPEPTRTEAWAENEAAVARAVELAEPPAVVVLSSVPDAAPAKKAAAPRKRATRKPTTKETTS